MISEKERGISMSRSRHTEAQMIAALKQVEAGRAVEDVAREKHKYGGMDVSQAQEAKQLRDENTRLRKLVADLSLHGRLRGECLSVNWFQNLFDARRKIASWKIECNEERPYSSLRYRTPQEFATAMRAAEAGSALLAPPSSAANPESESVV